MTDWGYKTEWSVSFDLPVDEKMKEFIDKMDKEHKEIEDVFTARIKKLFEKHVELDEAASLGYDKFLSLFRLGYGLGWNDHSDMLKGKEDGFDKAVEVACEWLKHNAERYVYWMDEEFGNKDLLEDFKKYMEGKDEMREM